jgi:hypothetical protein
VAVFYPNHSASCFHVGVVVDAKVDLDQLADHFLNLPNSRAYGSKLLGAASELRNRELTVNLVWGPKAGDCITIDQAAVLPLPKQARPPGAQQFDWEFGPSLGFV